MTSSSPRPLLTGYQRPCPHFNRSHAEEVAGWAKDPTLTHGMFYAVIFKMLFNSELVVKTSWLISQRQSRIVDGVSLKHGWIAIMTYEFNTTKCAFPSAEGHSIWRDKC